MRFISFAYTTPALLAGSKSVTRRAWSDKHAAGFHLAYVRGELVHGFDKSPRNGGKAVAEIRLTEAPFLQSIANMPDSDYEAEGFRWLHENGVKPPKSSGFDGFDWDDFDRWRVGGGGYLWVVRFELVRVL